MSRKQVAVKQRGVVKPSYSSEQLTVLPKPVYPWRTWAQACVAFAVLLGCLVWMGAARTYALAAVGVLLVGLAQGLRGFWLEMRAAAVAKTHTQVMHTLGFPVAYQVEWTGYGLGAPSKIVVDYPHVEHSDNIDSTITQAVNGAWAPRSFTTRRPKKTAALARKVPAPAPARAVAGAVSRVAAGLRPGPADRVVLWSYDPSAPDAEPDKTPLEVLEGRILDVSEQVFGDGAKVVDISTEGDQVTDFVVEHSYGPRLVDERVQIVLSMAVSQMVPGQWGADYDLERDRARFHWRRPLPKMAPLPMDPEIPDDSMALGVDEDGNYAVWVFAGLFAHMLLAGRTRTGKSVLLRTVLMTACKMGHRVFVIDPKRIEFMSLRDWPNVEMVSSKVEDQLALLAYLRDTMIERYRLIEEEGYSEDDFEHIFVIVDEYKQFVGNVTSWWRQNKVSGMPAQCPMIDYVGDLLRLAAAARIHVVDATQRPDADTMGGGEIRDNFSARGSTGSLSPDGAKMMYDNERTGVAVPKVQGRGYFAGTDDRPRQVQYFWTPNPRTAKTPEDLAILDYLRPATTTWPRKAWHYLSDEEIVAWQKEQAEAGREVKGSPAWLKILTATMVDYVPNAAAEEDLGDLPDDADLGDGYDEETMLCPSDLVEGDLILLEDGDHAGEWVSVTEVRNEGHDTVWVGWLSGDDDGLISTNDEIPVRTRHLLPFDDEA